MKPLVPWILVGVSLLSWLWAIKGCHDGSKEASALQDSLNMHRSITDSLVKKVDGIVHVKDSLLVKRGQDSLAFIRQLDSAKKVIAVLKGNFSKTKDSIGILYAQLRSFYLANDTAGLIATYNNLQDKLYEANEQLTYLQAARDSGDRIRDTEITRLNGVIKYTSGMLVEFQDAFAAEVKNSQGLANELEKILLKKKRAKIWDILKDVGIGVGGILIGKSL